MNFNVTKVRSLLDISFGRGRASRDGINYELPCPSCDDRRSEKKKLIVRLDDFRYHCWVCGIKGKDIWRLVQKIKPQLADQLPKGIKKITQVSNVEYEESIELPAHLVPVFWPSKDPDVVAVKNYLIKRGLSIENIARWRVMTSKTGRFRRHAVIPSFDLDGNVNYYLGRAIDDVTMKYRNAKISKKNVIFNEADIDWTRPITLVEGVFDAIKCPENTIPILGSSLAKSSRLYQKIVAKQSNVIISLDPDLKTKAYDLAERLLTDGCTVFVTFAPPGKDLGDLSFKAAKRIIDTSTRYTSYVRLTHKIGSISSGSLV